MIEHEGAWRKATAFFIMEVWRIEICAFSVGWRSPCFSTVSQYVASQMQYNRLFEFLRPQLDDPVEMN